MNIDLSNFVNKNDRVAVALSGGSDSVALLFFLKSKQMDYGFSLSAINVEHGIRGKQSLDDSIFVKNLCKKYDIPLFSYSVNAISNASKEGISLEESARILRYECFYKALSENKCDKIATAHHAKDNLESILFNLFRGTGLKGVSGIIPNYQNKIIRPFLQVSKAEIDLFIKENNLPFVTDSTNFDDKYSRNFIRLNIIPKIEEIFPDAEKNAYRFSSIVREEDEFLDSYAKEYISLLDDRAEIKLPIKKVIFNRSVIFCLKHLGIEKDWEKVHIDDVFSLINNENGKRIVLPKNIVAVREYDKIVFYTHSDISFIDIPFRVGKVEFDKKTYNIEKIENKNIDFKSGIYFDFDKIPKGAIIRTKRERDVFTKFGGGTKSLGDYLTDKKIPKRTRDSILLLAVNNDILAIFGIAVSDKVKADDTTKTLIKIT